MTSSEIIEAIEKAAGVLAKDPDRMRRLATFCDYWPEIEAYTPPPGVADDVHQIATAFNALAAALRAETGKEGER